MVMEGSIRNSHLRCQPPTKPQVLRPRPMAQGAAGHGRSIAEEGWPRCTDDGQTASPQQYRFFKCASAQWPA